LLRTLAAFMITQDQRTLSINARSDAGHAFLTKVGAQQKLLNLRNKLSLDSVDWEYMTQWRTAIDGIEPRLVWEIHEGRVPFERWATLYEPLNTLLSQMPTDGLNQTPIRYEEAGVKHISTYNVQSNKPMLAINQQMGFTLVREIAIYQIERDELKLFLEEG
jgi:hypothetical protein